MVIGVKLPGSNLVGENAKMPSPPFWLISSRQNHLEAQLQLRCISCVAAGANFLLFLGTI
jgi:hypothetical protein